MNNIDFDFDVVAIVVSAGLLTRRRPSAPSSVTYHLVQVHAAV